jgi:hypothetical protein
VIDSQARYNQGNKGFLRVKWCPLTEPTHCFIMFLFACF